MFGKPVLRAGEAKPEEPSGDPFDEFYSEFMSGDPAKAKDAMKGMLSVCQGEPDGDEPAKPSLLDGFGK